MIGMNSENAKDRNASYPIERGRITQAELNSRWGDAIYRTGKFCSCAAHLRSAQTLNHQSTMMKNVRQKGCLRSKKYDMTFCFEGFSSMCAQRDTARLGYLVDEPGDPPPNVFHYSRHSSVRANYNNTQSDEQNQN